MRPRKLGRSLGTRLHLLAVLTRFNPVVFDSFLHFLFVATGDGSALEEGKTRQATILHTLYSYNDTCWASFLEAASSEWPTVAKRLTATN